jgi:hypothetical protein
MRGYGREEQLRSLCRTSWTSLVNYDQTVFPVPACGLDTNAAAGHQEKTYGATHGQPDGNRRRESGPPADKTRKCATQ